ncbi:MAG: DUF402 domain-containing protein [Chloroflexi bacterium]|nr:DUF402 domain-containing protein [Chloroflexota bacterium]NJD66439.1 DUF402 domain-containing protein [Chloroflexota bacterium]PWB43305.1 MAG: hypothetical protein C3F10_11480 [Dehalococcoidia bacterium]
MTGPRWQPGDEVVLRYITRLDGVAGMTWPARVVRDDELLALYVPRGSMQMAWHQPPGQSRGLVEREWRRDMLRLMFPGKAHSVWCFWEGDERRFTSYYVNMEEPFRRTAIGVDTNDHALDIVVNPDLSWSWKDLDEFEGLVARGTYSPEFGQAVREEAEQVVADIEARREPFDAGWDAWMPPAGWELPRLHPRWRDEPAVPWERRAWAYRDAR